MVIAKIEKIGNSLTIRYTYEGFNKIYLIDKLFAKILYLNTNMRSMLFRIRRISSRNELTHRIIEGLIEHQHKYLTTGNPINLALFSQVQLTNWINRGAFTGADTAKEGRFELADGGTLFLDEVINLTASAQRRFLRVLEERKLQKLGGGKTVKIDVRIVVASIANLRDEVRKGTFRKDLFYRLNQFSIDIPSLQDRKEDIPVLVKHFLKDANSELKKKIKEISPEAMKAILNYSWPGNVRELKNVIRRAVLMAKGSVLPENLSLDPGVLTSQKDVNYESTMTPEANHFRTATKNIKEKEEKRLIKNAILQAEGNKRKAARILGIERSVLYYKMKKLGI